MQLIDIGANLTHESFRPDFDQVLERAEAQGVTRMVVTGASAAGSRTALSLAQSHPGRLFATAGVHPHHAVDYDDATDALLRELSLSDCVRAVGETGLDYHRNYSPPAAQAEAFQRQLEIAAGCGKPLFLHQRDAHADFMAMMKAFDGRLGKVVVHCFTGTREEMVDYLDAGWHIGITGWLCDERRGTHLRELVRDIPADRLMIETDSPYLLPRTVTPKPSHRRNEPMYLRHIVEELARDRGEEVELTAANATATSRAFFGI
ncbi:TatD family hydrolase [Dokdonella sp.]|uniref:TatD family hydrolase n=1 Tax=Dokdonella sp. TaxID=2291710 RepID=UPI003527B823